MHLNSVFISNVQDVYGENGKIWLKSLPLLLNELALLWNFRFLKPLLHLSYNFVGLVEIDGSPTKKAILKAIPTSGSIVNEIRWLKGMDQGVPKIYAFDEGKNAFLMEYLEPGGSLKELVKAGKDDLATKIICDTIRKLQSKQHTDFQFQHLSELPKALSILRGKFDTRLLSQAETWFRELTLDRTQDVVLHGDLHHDNILSSGIEWKAIDPHGYIGDPAAEAGVMIYNPLDSLPRLPSLQKVIERRLKIMAEELPFDPKRIKAWAFCRTVLSDAWNLEGHGKLTAVEVAIAIDKTKI